MNRSQVPSHRVSGTSLVLGNEGQTSSESLREALVLMLVRGLYRAISSSVPFHKLTLEILGRRFGIDPPTSSAPPNHGTQQLMKQWGDLPAESFKAPLALFVDLLPPIRSRALRISLLGHRKSRALPYKKAVIEEPLNVLGFGAVEVHEVNKGECAP